MGGRVNFDMVGRLLLGMTSNQSDDELKKTSRRSLTAHILAARDRGQPIGKKPAYGYRREGVPGQFRYKGKRRERVPVYRNVPNEVTAPVVRLIFQWRADGRSPGWIVA